MNKPLIEKLELFGQLSPIEPYRLKMIAFYCIIVFMLSLVFNTSLLVIFMKYKKLRTSLNMFILTLTGIHLFASISEFSFVIPSNMYGRWLTGESGCTISGFIMYTCGCTQIYMMTAISIQRFLIIWKPFTVRKMTFKVSFLIIAICILLGVFWASLPLFGWSRYSLEAGLTSCSVEWAERSYNVYSYNVTIFIFVFVIPVFIIIFCNLYMLTIIKSMPLMADEKNKQRLEKERKVTISLMIYVSGFIISWTPYAVVSLYSALIDPNGVSPLWSTLPAMFSKSSFVWSTVLFIYSNRNIRSKFTGEEVSKSTGEMGSTGHVQLTSRKSDAGSVSTA